MRRKKEREEKKVRKGKHNRTLGTGREVCGKQSTSLCENLVDAVYEEKDAKF